MEETLGKRIVAHRKRLGLTQDQLAEKMGITAQAVSKWENDQSCPDISALPQLADIFGITVDALLGRGNTEAAKAEEPIEEEPPVYEAEVVDEEDERPHFEMSFSSGKRTYIGPAVWVIAVGLFYLANILFDWRLSFWEVLWPTSLVTFGLFNLRSKALFLSLSCILVGGYVITSHFLPNPVIEDNRIIWAAIIILLGISLLADALRKKKRAHRYSPACNYSGDKEFCKTLDFGDDSFRYSASFGSDRVCVELPVMREGEIDVNFGDYIVDLRGVETVDAPAKLDVDASFGELSLLVPRRFMVNMHQDTSFSGVEIKGHPEEAPEGTIYMDADVSFGSLVIEYV